jgi:hypothetical protein
VVNRGDDERRTHDVAGEIVFRARTGEVPRRWPWVTIGVAITAALAIGWMVRFGGDEAAPRASATATARPDGWVPYHPIDGAYTVVGPPSPNVQTATTELGTQHAIRFDAPDGEILAVETVDLLPEVASGASERDLVSAWANRLLGQVNGVIDEQDILRAGTHPGVALRVDDDERRIVVRVFASGTHLYEVASAVPNSAPAADRNDAESFVDSFALTS